MFLPRHIKSLEKQKQKHDREQQLQINICAAFKNAAHLRAGQAQPDAHEYSCNLETCIGSYVW